MPIERMEVDWKLPEDPKEFAGWVAKQTPVVQKAARMFPVGSSPIVPIRVYVIGYSQDGDAVVITMDPGTLTQEELQYQASHALLLDPDQFKDGGPEITHEPVGRH